MLLSSSGTAERRTRDLSRVASQHLNHYTNTWPVVYAQKNSEQQQHKLRGTLWSEVIDQTDRRQRPTASQCDAVRYAGGSDVAASLSAAAAASFFTASRVLSVHTRANGVCP